MLTRLTVLGMATDPTIDNIRRGFWLRMARERANLTQSAVAESLGLSSESKSTMSAWEAGTREPKLRYLKAMAQLYGVPLETFTDPGPTASEDLDRLVELATGAAKLARQDLEAGEEQAPNVDDEPGRPRGRRSA